MNKLVSIKEVIYRIEDLVVETPNLGDIYEWCAQALSHIGGEVAQELIVTDPPLEIKNFRAKLPCNYHTFLRFLSINNTEDTVNLINNIPPDLPHGAETIYLRANPIVNLNNPDYNFPTPLYNGISQSHNPWLEPTNNLTVNTPFEYRFENDSILFNIEEGTITMQYWAIPLDEDQAPLIPDLESYKEALQWYVLKQLSYRGFQFKNPEFNLNFLEAKWKFYCQQARNDRMPDVHSLQRMVNERMRFLPIDTHYYTSFRYLGIQQHEARHGRY